MIFGSLSTLIIGFGLGLFCFYRWPIRFQKFIKSFIDLFKKDSDPKKQKDVTE